MRQAQLSELLERAAAAPARTSPLKSAQRPELRARGPARADEVRVIGVREAVRSRPFRPDDAALRESQTANPRRRPPRAAR